MTLYKKYGKAREVKGTVGYVNAIWGQIDAIGFWVIKKGKIQS
jgi:hypothetical protein